MDTPPALDESRRVAFDQELLAWGRVLLEDLCGSARWRYLYPEGPNIALLLEGYQDFDRLRTVGRIRGGRWRQRRRFKAILVDLVRRDVLARTQRLSFHYPGPRLHRLPPPPPAVRRALDAVSPPLRAAIENLVLGIDAPSGHGAGLLVSPRRHHPHAPGIDEFRDALVGEVLASPDAVVGLHPQYLGLLAAPMPKKRHHPVASFLLVKLPLQLALAIITLFNIAYVGAYYFFNDEVLGDFVSSRVSGLLEGELEMGSIHWEGRLIFDLVTGTPHHVVVENVNVWDAYENYGGQRKGRAAHADRIEATLVLHEIIPWNMLGIPTMFEIPWVLHFPEVEIEQPIWFRIREYEDEHAQRGNERLISLLGAFQVLDPHPDRQGLSFAVDDAKLASTVVDIDFTELGAWRTYLEFDHSQFMLEFEAPDPGFTDPMELPFAFVVEAQGGDGSLKIDEVDVPIADLNVLRLASNREDVQAGDVLFDARGSGAESTVTFAGLMTDVFARKNDQTLQPLTGIRMRAHTPDAGGITAHLLRELELPPETVRAEGASVSATLVGPMSDPVYTLAAQGLRLDVAGEPRWAADEVSLALTLAHDEVPEAWADRFDESDPRIRRVVTFDHVSGKLMGGTFEQLADDDAPPAQIVMPEDDEPYLMRAAFALDQVDPGRLFPPETDDAAMLRGRGSGTLLVHDLVIGVSKSQDASAEPPPEGEDGSGVQSTQLEFRDFELTRQRGPRDDSLPQRLGVDGTVTLDADSDLDASNLVVTTDGTRLLADGRIEREFTRMKSLLLDLQIDNGRAFSNAFGLPHYFDRLDARMTFVGPIKAPSGHDGSLSIDGLLEGRGIEGATMSMNSGTLVIRAPNVRVYGGVGEVYLRVGIIDRRGDFARNPEIYAKVVLDEVDLGVLVADGPLSGRAHVELEVGDGHGDAAPLSDVRVEGLARSETLQIGQTTYRGARVSFDLTSEELSINQIVLPVHRPVSPLYASGVTVPVGELVGDGTISLESDPEVDLVVGARGVPLSVVTQLLEVDVPVHGQLADGTRVRVQGRLSRPKVEGTVALQHLAALGIRLGDGSLEVTSDDFETDGPLAAHREVRVSGELATPPDAPAQEAIQWTLDAVLAIGRKQSEASPPVAAQLDVEFDRLSIASLLRDPLEDRTAPVEGRLEGLSARVLTCNEGTAMLSDCLTGDGDSKQRLSIDLALDRAWARSSASRSSAAEPCEDPSTLCSQNALAASIDWPRISLSQPWRLASGPPDDRATVILKGSFDMSTPPAAAPAAGASACRPPPVRAGNTTLVAVGSDPKGTGSGDANVEGLLDFDALAPLLQGLGIAGAKGRLYVDMDVDGYAQAPTLHGYADLVETDDGFSLSLAALPFPIGFRSLRLQVDDGWLAAAGKMDVLGGQIEFGTVDGENTGWGFSGPCAGHFAAAARGLVSSNLIATYAGDTVARGQGGLDLRSSFVHGHVADEVVLDALRGRVDLEEHDLKLEFSDGLTTTHLTGGEASFERCAQGACGGVPDGWFKLVLGPDDADPRGSPPKTAIAVESGPRGRGALWGRAFVSPDLTESQNVALRAVLDDIPFRTFDGQGRQVVEGEMSSTDAAITGGQPLVATGRIDLDRTRYVKDAVTGVEILALIDDVETVSTPPPELLQGLQFDLDMATDRPLRVENNIASGVAADLNINVSGTYEDPEFTGRIDVEPGGRVDVPFVTGTYEIERGRVTLLRRIEDAEVDVLAVRQEPIYINGQPREIRLALAGTLSAVRWTCLADGSDTSELDTVRGCTEYLVLGAGDVQVSDSEVQRFGGGGLANARKPLQVVGHLTEFDVGKRAAEAAPRAKDYIPDTRLRLGQIGPELQIATPSSWWEWDWGRATLGWDYTRGYPGFLLRQSRELKFRLEILDPMSIEYSRRTRDYLNERIIFDPLQQTSVELRFDWQIPTIR